MTLHDEDQLESQLRQALAGRAATTTIHEPPGVGVRALRPRVAPRPDARRVLAAAAAVVALVGGLLTATRLATDGHEPTTAGNPGQQPGDRECGGDLPLELPVPDGFEGPLPGPAPGTTVPPDQPARDDDLQVHWTSPDATIDVSWPAFPHPKTPYESDVTSIARTWPEPGDGRPAIATFASTRLGSGACATLGVTVTSRTEDTTVYDQTVLNKIQIGLAGAGGPLAIPPEDLVTSSATAAALPTDIVPCADANVDLGLDPLASIEIYPEVGHRATPAAALLAFMATTTKPHSYAAGWEELRLPDGSVGYVLRDPEQGNRPTTVVRVVEDAEGWRVYSGTTSNC